MAKGLYDGQSGGSRCCPSPIVLSWLKRHTSCHDSEPFPLSEMPKNDDDSPSRCSNQSPFEIPELIDLVIDYLHDDNKALRACALVAKAWLPSSSFHLLGTATVRGHSGMTSVAWRLKSSVRLQHTLKHIAIIPEPGVRQFFTPLAYMMEFARNAWTLQSLVLVGLLFLDELAFQSIPDFNPIVSHGSIQHLAIESCTFEDRDFFCLLGALPSLKRLSIRSMTPFGSPFEDYSCLGESSPHATTSGSLTPFLPSIQTTLRSPPSNRFTSHARPPRGTWPSISGACP